jgi:hypothetical protein
MPDDHDHPHDHPHDHDHAHDHAVGADAEVDDEEARRLADELAEATSRMAGQLGWAIAPHRERSAYALAGAPVAVVFERAQHRAAKPKHRPDEDNPYLIPLVLACFYAVESSRSGALGLGPATRRTEPTVELLEDDDATADIRGVPGTAMLRTITPVEADDRPARVTAIQFVWRT